MLYRAEYSVKLFNEGRLRVCGVMTGTCNLSILEVEAGRGHEFEANVDNMAGPSGFRNQSSLKRKQYTKA